MNDDRHDITRMIVGEEPHLDGDEVAQRSGVDRAMSKRLWRALGFPDTGDSVAYGTSDVEALTEVKELLDSGRVSDETVVRLARAVGQTMSRLSDWQVTTLIDASTGATRADDAHSDDTGTPDTRLRAALELADDLTPGFENLLVYAWRRHLAAAATRAEELSADEVAQQAQTLTVGFADMSRFSLLSNDLDNERLAHVAETFENVCVDHVTNAGGRVIKALGDAVLYVFDDPDAAASASLELISLVAAHEDLPDVRVGMATGSVINRLGDVFGSPVNLAARLSNVARSNRMLVDDTTASALPNTYERRVLQQRPVRGFGVLSPVNVMRRRAFRKRDC